MIRPIDIRLNAAHPDYPLAEAVTFTGSPSTVLIRGVPPNCGRWAITAVSVAATFPDGSTTTRAAVQSANGVWVATLPATATSGRTANGLRVIADGIDENGAAVTGYILGVADFAVASLAVTPAPQPGETSWQMLYFDAVPGTLRKGDVAKIDGVLKLYNGTAWEEFATPPTLDDAVTRDSTNGVKSSGIWSAIWGALSALPTGFSSLYDWCVTQLAGKMPSTATGADIPVSGSVAMKIDAALAGKATTTDATLTPIYGGNGEKYSDWVCDPAQYEGHDIEVRLTTYPHPVYDAIQAWRFFVIGTDEPCSTSIYAVNGQGVPDDAATLVMTSITSGTLSATRAANPIIGYRLGPDEQTNPNRDKTLASEAEAEALRTGKANRASSPTAGNLAALDANGNPTDAGWTAGDIARYALTTKTINNGAVSLDDRAINAVAVSSSLASLTVNFPTATNGKARDFGLRLTVASGITTAPELVLPQGVMCENADGEVPEIGADGAATILYFTETASGVFLVKGETLTAITQA